MRRALMAVTMSGVLLAAAGCGTKSATDAPAASAPTSAAPTSAAPSPSADYTADTKKICASIDKTMDAGLNDFGTELGKMIAYKQANSTTQANKAKAAAQKEAKTLAGELRTGTAAALDPELKAAGEEAATNIEKSAASDAFFAGMKTVKDLDKLEGEISGWVVPLATFCG